MSNNQGSNIKKQWIVEHVWKCSSCNFENKGRDKVCLNCGSPKDEYDTEFIPSNMSQSKAVSDPNLIKQFSAGPDWICSYCNHHEKSYNNKCTQCGASKGEKKNDVKNFAQNQNNVILKPVPIQPQLINQRSPVSSYSSKKPGKKIKLFLFLLIPALFVWFIYYFFGNKEITVKVTQTKWSYDVFVRQRTIKHNIDWQENMQAHAFNVSCETKQKGTKNCNPYQCNPHQVAYNCNPRQNCTTSQSCSTSCVDNGNGSSTCTEVCNPTQNCTTEYDTCYRTEYDTCWQQCPVFAQWCSYDYPDWAIINNAHNEGFDHNPIRPALLSPSKIACQRDNELLPTGTNDCAEDKLTFNVVFSNDEKSWNFQPASLIDYNRFIVNHNWLVRVNRFGRFTPIKATGN